MNTFIFSKKNTLYHNVVLCLFIWLASISCFAVELAQNVRFRHLTVDDGLSQESVYQILQDNFGFMWFATSEGLNRYDGHEFITYLYDPKKTNSLSNDWVWSLLESSDGKLWVGTDGGGLNLINDDGRTFKHFKHDPEDPKSISGDIVRTIIEDNDGNLWVGTDSGLNQLNVASQEFERFVVNESLAASLSSNKVRAIVQEQHGSLWIGTDGGGLNQMDIARKTIRHFRHNPQDINSISSDRIRCMLESIDGMLWVGTYDQGLNRYNPRTGYVKRYNEISGHGLSNNFIRDIIQDHRGILWIATDNGLFEYRAESDSFVRYNNETSDTRSLTNNRVISLYQDTGKVLWVGTYAGINLWNYQTTSFEIFNQSENDTNQLRSNTILSFAQSDDNTIWVGTYAGLHKYSLKTGNFDYFGKKQGLLDETITALTVDDNYLWIGSFSSGLTRMDLTTQELKYYQPDENRKDWLLKGGVTSLDIDSAGNLWVANFDGALLRYNKSSDNFTAFNHREKDENGSLNNRIIYVLASRNDEIWLSILGKGVAKFNPDSEEFVFFQPIQGNTNSLSSDINWVIMEDQQGNLWFGTQGKGVDMLSVAERRKTDSIFKNISRVDGLKSNVIYGIQEDDKGELWFSSNRGITRFSPGNNNMQHYGPHHGLQSFEFNSGAHFRSRSGKMYFGGSNGFNAFYPTEILRNQHPPQVALTKIIKVNNTVMENVATHILSSLTIKPDDYPVSFEFAALDYAAVEANRYQYRLDGYDNKWINTQEIRRATYTNLPNGQYTFKVKAANSDGVWNEDGVALNIRVLSPWYLTTSAYLVYLFLMITLSTTIYQIYLSKKKKKDFHSRKLEKIVDRRTSKLQRKANQLQERNNELRNFNKQLSEASMTDVCTGLYNRRFVTDYMLKVSQNLERRLEKMTLIEVLATNRPVFFLLLDIDNFKQLNESFGYDAGDKLLLSVGRILAKHCRLSDVLSRWGSDSFIVIGETEDVDSILMLAQRLINSIATHKFVLDKKCLTVTASVGITYFPFSVSQVNLFKWEQVIAIAESIIKLSKDKGGGQYVCARAGQLGLNRSDFRRIITDPQAMADQQLIHLLFEDHLASNGLKTNPKAEKYED